MDRRTKCALDMIEQAKAQWIGNIDDMFKLAICDYYYEDIINNRKTITTKLTSAIYLWAKQVCNYKIYTWEKIESELEDKRPTFGYTNVMGRYDSFLILKWLFRTNFPDHDEKVLSLKPWFNKTNKKNTILMIGPPSCGKSWFGTALAKLGLFVGSILNYAKGSSFVFGNTTNCRIILHDECQWPIGAPEYTETLKMLYGGQRTPVDVKFETQQFGGDCPVIAMANDHPCKDPKLLDAFLTRVDQWNFTRSLDELKRQDPNEEFPIPHVTGPCHPMAIFDLYNYYESNQYMDSE